MSKSLSEVLTDINPAVLDSPYLKDIENTVAGWGSAFQTFNTQGFNFPLVEKAVPQEDMKKTPETTLSNGSKIKNYINTISTQGAAVKFPIIARELNFKKVEGEKYYSFKSSDLPTLRAECFPTNINVPHRRRVVDIKYLAFDHIITHLRYCAHDSDHTEATKSEKGYRHPNDDVPFNVVGAGIADHQFYNSYMKWEVRFEFADEPDVEDEPEVSSFWIFQIAPLSFPLIGRVLSGVAPSNDFYNNMREDLKKVREGENIQLAGITIKGTFHVPITFERKGKSIFFTPTRGYRACAGLFIMSEHRPKYTKVLDSVTPVYVLSRRYNDITTAQFGFGLNLTTAHSNALFNVDPSVVFELEYDDESQVPDKLDGYVIQSRLMNINKHGVVELH